MAARKVTPVLAHDGGRWPAPRYRKSTRRGASPRHRTFFRRPVTRATPVPTDSGNRPPLDPKGAFTLRNLGTCVLGLLILPFLACGGSSSTTITGGDAGATGMTPNGGPAVPDPGTGKPRQSTSCSGGGTCSCSSGNCQSTCSSSPCTMDCSSGNCQLTCPASGDCTLDCSSGHCLTYCGDGTCSVDCSSGDCNTSCPPGATCNVSCSGGGCVLACGQGASCSFTSCPAGSCSCTGAGCH